MGNLILEMQTKDDLDLPSIDNLIIYCSIITLLIGHLKIQISLFSLNDSEDLSNE